ncbi:MAG: trimethylamine methyltransferase family protein [Armatimonadota bacterium]
MKLTTRAMQVLSEQEMERIWQAALRIWARVPLRAPGTDEFMSALRDFGCTIDGDRIGFPEDVREKTLARIAAAREQAGPPRPAVVEDARVGYQTNGQAFYACDFQTERLRMATTADLEQWCHVCDLYPEMGRGHPTFIPQDVPRASCDVHTFATVILHSSRPCLVSVYDAEMIPFFIELQAVAEGSVEAVREHPVFNTMCYMNSPFMISREAIEIGMSARELLDQPLRIFSMPVMGTAMPVTLAGTLALATAECLAANVVTLALDDRLSGWTEAPVSFDMRAGAAVATGPEVNLLRLACQQMAAHLFGGQWSAMAGLSTSAKAPGPQAMTEKALEGMWGLANGVRSFASLGILATSDAASVTQLMLDLEIVGFLARLARGVECDDERIAEELSARVAPRGAYFLDQEHTARHFREELWLPELMDRRTPMAWAADPTDMLARARTKAARVIAAAQNHCPLSDEQRRQVAEIVAAADAAADRGGRRQR